MLEKYWTISIAILSMDSHMLAVLFAVLLILLQTIFSLIFRFDVCFMGVVYVCVVKRAQKISIGSEEKINMITLLYKKEEDRYYK